MKFEKMQGAGNDFIVMNNLEERLPASALSALAKHLCRRRVSIGGNALMLVDSPRSGGDFRMVFYNADGTEAEMCGNGARCIARYAYEHGLAGPQMTIETVAGQVRAWRLDARTYKIQLNAPTVVQMDQALRAAGRSWQVDYIELGDPGLPHAVVACDELDTLPEAALRPIGAELRAHSHFPRGANINFYKLGDGEVLLKTYERGVEDFTLACGTGSGATALALRLRGLAAEGPVKLRVPGGLLQVEVDSQTSPAALFLIGDTNQVAEGTVLDEDWQG